MHACIHSQCVWTVAFACVRSVMITKLMWNYFVCSQQLEAIKSNNKSAKKMHVSQMKTITHIRDEIEMCDATDLAAVKREGTYNPRH